MLISSAYAQAAGNNPASDPILTMLIPMAFVFAVFYFLVIRPQNKKIKEQKARIDAAKRGDEVVTGGGIVGKIVHVREDKLEIEIAPNVRIKVIKGTLTHILTKVDPISAEKKK